MREVADLGEDERLALVVGKLGDVGERPSGGNLPAPELPNPCAPVAFI